VNIQEYISSGIIESYVLGLASAEERIEFEQLCSQYPELIEARKRFEEAIEKQAIGNAPAPPAFLKERIWSEIQQSSSKIITMEPTRRNSGLGWIAAASIILFLAAGYFAYKFYNESKDLRNSNKELEARVNKSDSILNRLTAEQKVIQNPNAIVVNLVATQKAQPSSASIYWDSTSSNVFMVVKNMPKLPSNKQYQLWALIDGKPKDLGLFDGTEPNVILKMNNTQKADAFAITIENRGNTGGPTLPEGLQSMGKAKLQ
jgi:anti-sigma-K factor RskA